jgi:hypothetical protein
MMDIKLLGFGGKMEMEVLSIQKLFCVTRVMSLRHLLLSALFPLVHRQRSDLLT